MVFSVFSGDFPEGYVGRDLVGVYPTSLTSDLKLYISKVVSPHLWYTPLNLYQLAIKGLLS